MALFHQNVVAIKKKRKKSFVKHLTTAKIVKQIISIAQIITFVFFWEKSTTVPIYSDTWSKLEVYSIQIFFLLYLKIIVEKVFALNKLLMSPNQSKSTNIYQKISMSLALFGILNTKENKTKLIQPIKEKP